MYLCILVSSIIYVYWCPALSMYTGVQRYLCILVSSVIYVYWCPALFLYHMMFVSFNSNMSVATSGAVTPYPSGAPEFIGICVAQSLVFCVVFCTLVSLFVLFCWPLQCLSYHFRQPLGFLKLFLYVYVQMYSSDSSEEP